MTVEDPSVIDLVAHDPNSDVVSFVLVEHREWGDQGNLLPDLQRKLNTYLGYVLDGHFGKAYSQYVGKRLVFDLRTAHPPGSRERAFLEVVRTQDLEPRGIGLTWRQYRFPDDLPSESESSGTRAEETNQ